MAGWAYAVVSYGPLGTQLRGNLVTGLLIDRLMPPMPVDPGPNQLWQVERLRWHLAGHVLFALVIGVAGGVFATRIGERRGDVPETPAS
jgi:hypothetical protein